QPPLLRLFLVSLSRLRQWLQQLRELCGQLLQLSAQGESRRRSRWLGLGQAALLLSATLRERNGRFRRRRERRKAAHTSTLAVSALSWMKSRRGSTSSPISFVKMSSASSTSFTFTCSSERTLVSSVVSQSCPGFISPRPL